MHCSTGTCRRLSGCSAVDPRSAISVSTRSFDHMTAGVCCERRLTFWPWISRAVLGVCVRVIPFLKPLEKDLLIPRANPWISVCDSKAYFVVCLRRSIWSECAWGLLFAWHVCVRVCARDREKEFALSLLGDAWGLLLTATLQGLSLRLLEVHVYLNSLLMTCRGFRRGYVPKQWL